MQTQPTSDLNSESDKPVETGPITSFWTRWESSLYSSGVRPQFKDSSMSPGVNLPPGVCIAFSKSDVK